MRPKGHDGSDWLRLLEAGAGCAREQFTGALTALAFSAAREVDEIFLGKKFSLPLCETY
jgi:hypothetical protein